MLCHGHWIFSESDVINLGIWICYLCHISWFADMISCLILFCFQTHEVVDVSGQIWNPWNTPNHAIFCQRKQNFILEACELMQYESKGRSNLIWQRRLWLTNFYRMFYSSFTRTYKNMAVPFLFKGLVPKMLSETHWRKQYTFKKTVLD